MNAKLYTSFSAYLNRRLAIIILLVVAVKLVWNGTFALCYIFQQNFGPIGFSGDILTITLLGILFYRCLKLNPASQMPGFWIFCALFYLLYRIPPIDFNQIEFRFRIHKQQYISEVEADQSQSPKFIVIPWGELAAFPAGGVWETLIYDETDQLGLPPERRSPDWSARHGGYATKMLPQCGFEIMPLGEHFFYTYESC